jgi:hypothetical protein
LAAHKKNSFKDVGACHAWQGLDISADRGELWGQWRFLADRHSARRRSWDRRARCRRLRPRFAHDYPRSLTAHDIGLKDVLNALYLLGHVPDVTLFTVSIEPPGELGTDLSPPVAAQVPVLAARVRDEASA